MNSQSVSKPATVVIGAGPAGLTARFGKRLRRQNNTPADQTVSA